MIRPAKAADAFALAALLSDLHAETIYNGLEIDPAYTRKLFAQFAHRHGGSHDGATCMFVYEHEGEIAGFVAGMLDRVYHVGHALWSNDVYLHVRKDSPKRAMPSLLKAYLAWAEDNSNVYEVRLSTSNAAGTADRLGALYERMGFVECGRVYQRRNPNFIEKRRSNAA